MWNFKKKKLKSSSLHESVISIVIISIVIAVCTMIYFNVTNSLVNQRSYYLLLNKIDNLKFETEIELESEKFEKELLFMEYKIVKSISYTENMKNKILTISAYKQNKRIINKTYILSKF